MNNSVQDLVLMVIFGIIGYGMKRADVPASPIILGMVLGKQMEEKFRQSMVISDGSLAIFLQRPIAVFFLIVAFISITNPYWKYIPMGIRKLLGKSPKAA
jgi:putative tricarboxylic transport membrane protein